MKTLRLYVDTSVIGGYFDPEFATVTKRLFRDIAMGRYAGVISDLVARELLRAPAEVRALVEENPDIKWEFVQENIDATALARAYLAEGFIAQRLLADCMHVALATVCQADLLVSWNFRHIVRFDRIRQFNAVNMKLGYGMLEIRSPREVAYEE